MLVCDLINTRGSLVTAHRLAFFKPLRVLVLAALIPMVGTVPTRSQAEDLPWSPPPLNGSADELLDGREVVLRAVDFMKGLPALNFQAVATYETVQENGQKLQFDMLHRVTHRRPDKLHWSTLYDDAEVETAWCGDGTFTLIRQPANIWGRIKVSPELSEALTSIAEDYNLVVPFMDIFAGDPAELWLGDEVQSVDYVGASWIDGWWTDQVAIRKPGVDIQLWFRRGDEPFPVKFSVIRNDEDQMPGYTARFREWSARIPGGSIPPFTPPEDSERIEVLPAHGN